MGEQMLRKIYTPEQVDGMDQGQFAAAKKAEHQRLQNTNFLHLQVAAAAAPGASSKHKSDAKSAAAVLDNRYQSGSAHPRSLDEYTETHALLDSLFHRLLAVVPGISILSRAELKQTDVSKLKLLEHPAEGRIPSSGLRYSELSNIAFRESLLKFVRKQCTAQQYIAFATDSTLLHDAYKKHNAAEARKSRNSRLGQD